jgi:uncharacterized protein YqjF (DUF2071 family)
MALLAPSPAALSERPTPRWCHARVRLEDFAIINWSVDPERVQRCLPPGFEADQQRGTASIAMIAFNNCGFHFRAAPFARLSCGQADYRTFVRHGDERGVWFFGGSLSSKLVSVATALWKMPWHYDAIDITAPPDDDSGGRWSLEAAGSWGAAAASLTTTGRALPTSPGLTVNPLVGWYPRRDGGVGRYSVWHQPLQLREAHADVRRCDVFERLDLIDKGQVPSGAGLQRSIEFDIHTPPTRLAGGFSR